jgi:hypothetical protein
MTTLIQQKKPDQLPDESCDTDLDAVVGGLSWLQLHTPQGHNAVFF